MMYEGRHVAKSALGVVAENDQHPEVSVKLNGWEFFLSTPFDRDVWEALMQHQPTVEKVRTLIAQLSELMPDDGSMTDNRALREIEEALATLENHWDNGFLLGFWSDRYEGFQFQYADGRYADLALQEAEDTQDAA